MYSNPTKIKRPSILPVEYLSMMTTQMLYYQLHHLLCNTDRDITTTSENVRITQEGKISRKEGSNQTFTSC